MKCYTIVDKEPVQWINIKEEPYPHIAIGEQGRGRKISRVGLGKRDFSPTPKKIEKASVIRTKEKGTLLVIAEKQQNDDRILVVLGIPMGYRGHTEWEGLDSPLISVLTEGTIAQGAAGRMGSYQKYLAILSPGIHLKCTRYGRLYGDTKEIHILYTKEKELLVGSEDEVFQPNEEDIENAETL